MPHSRSFDVRQVRRSCRAWYRSAAVSFGMRCGLRMRGAAATWPFIGTQVFGWRSGSSCWGPSEMMGRSFARRHRAAGLLRQRILAHTVAWARRTRPFGTGATLTNIAVLVRTGRFTVTGRPNGILTRPRFAQISFIKSRRPLPNKRLKLTAPVVCGKLSFVIIPVRRRSLGASR